jgi:endonuclease III
LPRQLLWRHGDIMTKPYKRQMTAAEIDRFFHTLAEQRPEPETELAYGNFYQLLVAVVLSAQATDVGVNKATRRLFEQVHTPQQMLELGEAGLKQHIRTIGLFNAKAKHVIALSHRLVNDFGGEVPRSRDALESLPGVGRKTANVVVNVLFGEETCAVDTHVFRLANRTGLAPGKTPLAVETGIMKRVKAPWRRHAHHWLILHGRYVCTARSPKCGQCAVLDQCQFREKPAASSGAAR